MLFLFTSGVFGLGEYHRSGDTIPNELLAVSILREGDLDFDEFVPNRKLLRHFYWFQEAGGRVASLYPIVPGILNLPAYSVASLLGVDITRARNCIALSHLTAIVVTALSVVFLYRVLARLCRGEATAVAFSLVYVFGTCAGSVAPRSLWQHGPSLLFLTAALFLLVDPSARRVPWAGFLLGMSVWNRPTNILLALPLTLYVWKRHRASFAGFAALAAVPAFFLFSYSSLYLGSVFALGQGQGAGGFDGDFVPGLLGLLVSPGRGLFVFSPFFLFAFAALFHVLRTDRFETILPYLALSVLATIGLYSKWSMWWGGHSFGYRLLIEIVPALTIFAALEWEKISRSPGRLRWIFAGLVVLSFYVHFLGAFFYPSRFNISPNLIDDHPGRLWEIRDTELLRLNRKLVRMLEHLVHPRESSPSS